MTLLRGQRHGLLWRVKNLWINRRDPPQLEEIALALVSPSYLSFETAMYKQGILSQSPRGALTAATLGRPRVISTPLGQIQFFHLKPDIFFGFNEERIAWPEKAILDLCYIRLRKGLEPLPDLTFYPEELNRRRLRELAERFPSYVFSRLQTRLAQKQ